MIVLLLLQPALPAPSSAVAQSLVKVALPMTAIAIVLGIARLRRLSWPDMIGLRAPSLAATCLWVGLAAAWMLASDGLIGWRGPWDFTAWRATPLIASFSRVLAIGVLGPIAEELIFRGVLYGRLSTTRLKPMGSVVLLALAWAMIHTAYSPAVIAVIFVEGMLLGAARWRTSSVIPPILMHMVWNFYAVW